MRAVGTGECICIRDRIRNVVEGLKEEEITGKGEMGEATTYSQTM